MLSILTRVHRDECRILWREHLRHARPVQLLRPVLSTSRGTQGGICETLTLAYLFSFFFVDFSPWLGLFSKIIAPEAELLNLGEVINAQNALYSVLSGQLHWCFNGVGASWGRGVSNSCGSLDGSNKYSPAYLDYSPVGNATDASNVVGQVRI